ncbi:MAG: DEAD/DEAH box helicase [Chitinophagales bacterium]|nr:DEAD/DEAH box helicase [Chitinophagales bacterium]
MRKTYGNTWWGKQWLNALNNIDYSNRLPRGRTYANKGMAHDIEINKNRITAKVSGSRPRPYRVDFKIPLFDANAKAKIIGIITENPLFLSQLLNRELPKELKETCEKVGIHLFPKTWQDITGGCSCPDWAVPCKHMASVLYLVANEIDKNPFLVFELHGFDLFKGLEGIGYTTSGQKEVSILAVNDLWKKHQLSDKLETVDILDVINQLDFTQIPESSESLLALLSEKPVFFPSGDFKKIVTKAYSSISKSLLQLHKKEVIRQESTSVMDTTEHIECFLDEELDFTEATFRDAKGKSLITFKNLEELINWLNEVPVERLHQYSQSLIGLYYTYRFALKLAQQSAFLPQILRVGAKHYRMRWLAATLNEDVRKVFSILEELVPHELVYYKIQKEIYQPVESDRLQALVSTFLNYLVQTHYKIDRKLQDQKVSKLFFNGSLESFRDFETKEFPAAIQLWLNRFFIVEKDYVPILKVDDQEGDFEISIAIENRNEPLKAPVSLEDLFVKDAFKHIRLDILRDIAMLSEYFPQISRLVSSKGIDKLFFDSNEFVNVLFKILPTIRLFGIKILLPKALRKLLRPQLSMALESDESAIVAQSGIVSMENMLRFRWQVAIGDQQMTPEAFLKLLKQYSGIVQLNEQYVFFDENEVRKLIDKLENPPELSTQQLLQAALTESYQGAKVILDNNSQRLIDSFRNSDKIAPPQGLKAILRPYQQSGFEWLYKNLKLGFGSLLADDMGLGKTLQIITILLKLKEEGAFEKKKALIVVPTTLLTNWVKEVSKFAPGLIPAIYHGTNRNLTEFKEADLIITTYGVVRSDSTKLNKQKWLAIIIDEAQNIKNPTTIQTKAIKKIKAPFKIAMSGTPVENRLTEYWSIFDFVNKNYLGNLNKFKETYAKPIEINRDQAQLNHFRKVTEPFILRRVKTDKSIIKDLPDKIEKDQFCELTSEQAAIYQNVIDTMMKDIEQAEGIARRGSVLKLITALKQICNHPRHFLKKGDTSPTLSGKAILLFQLIKTVLENDEKALIFTQYQEMGKLLVNMLETEFKLDIPFLHGGVSRKGRDEMVESFQHNRSTKILILSLKAGGTGLNLTAASNVIHYDLWWNPAVEAQATDRAYRIGQNKNVLVHRFITQGTFEEKINQLLLNKKELANLTVSTGEKWIGEFSNEELKELIQLG